ncbi:type II toxin-antitoxin system RelE/ParE family toxin [Desulfuromonas carbonis]|uniref:type II toxin-antitoxin system RelE family toxin n=1 Tax=Desulfuromonas sp. DDH964 TaxID=1823759 RepID=UPI00078D3E87|nr:type II toxin-antitoxin system RelE/ParE family toxin [Desulfuromonas sp. DDH964]AMV73339.1 Toxin RelE [Desulfuromonas sp. DDH964]
MTWTIKYTSTAKVQLRKLDRPVAARILDYMDQRVAILDDPRTLGKALSGNLGGLWRYRVGDCRVICEIQGTSVSILVVKIGNRREVYR